MPIRAHAFLDLEGELSSRDEDQRADGAAALGAGSVEALQHYARDLSERIIPRGVETHEVVGIVLLLRDVLARSLFEKYQQDFGLLNRVLDAYEPAANRIANTVAVSTYWPGSIPDAMAR